MCGHHRTGPDGLVTKSDEELIWSGKISWKSIIVPLLAALVGTIFFSMIVAVESPVAGFFIFIIFTIGIVIAAVLHKIRSEYAVTTQRVYSRSGIISDFSSLLKEGSFGRSLVSLHSYSFRHSHSATTL